MTQQPLTMNPWFCHKLYIWCCTNCLWMSIAWKIVWACGLLSDVAHAVWSGKNLKPLSQKFLVHCLKLVSRYMQSWHQDTCFQKGKSSQQHFQQILEIMRSVLSTTHYHKYKYAERAEHLARTVSFQITFIFCTYLRNSQVRSSVVNNEMKKCSVKEKDFLFYWCIASSCSLS